LWIGWRAPVGKKKSEPCATGAILTIKWLREFGTQMLIGFESSILNRSMTGVANYTFNIVRCAMDIAPDIGFAGFGGLGWRAFDRSAVKDVESSQHKLDDDGQSRATSFARIKNLMLDSAAGWPTSRVAGAAYREMRKIRFSASVRKQSIDLFHAFNFRPLSDPGVPTLPVIYDLSTFRHPEFHPPDRVRWLEPLRQLAERAPAIQTISDFSRREIADIFGYPLAKIFVAPPAAAPVFVPLGRELTQLALDKVDLKYGEFFLVVGTHEPRKNIRTAILAYERLPKASRERMPLVLAGGRGWGDLNLPAQTERLVGDGSVRFVHGVTDPQLRSLYEGARLLLAPSLYEGFGMPVVEALACGTPVGHSINTSMDEISGDMGTRVASLDVEGWTSVLKDALESDDHADPARREARIARARQFDWRHSAELVIDAYRRMLN
jgi:glycosyltransferase involved in cell wall biosynthesis